MTKICDKFTGRTIVEGDMELKELVAYCAENKIGLDSAELKGADLSNLNLSGINLNSANLQDTCLINTNLEGSNISFANFKCAKLYLTNLSKTYAVNSYFRCASLIGVNMENGNFMGANFMSAEISNINMGGAIITNADFMYSDIHSSSFYGAKINEVIIKKIANFTGLYRYTVMPIIAEDNSMWIQLGSFLRKVSDWENDFWNDRDDFISNDSKQSKLRLLAYETCKRWLMIESNKGE